MNSLILRKPRRLTVTVPSEVLDRLVQQADEQGRSTSNLAAYLLELAISQVSSQHPHPQRQAWAR